MTQKDKNLLLIDLCARLLYRVKVKYYSMEYPYGSKPVILTPYLLYDRWENISEMRPYLRPMSSMTEEEREEIEIFICDEWFINDDKATKVDSEGFIEFLSNYDCSGIYPEFCGQYVDWLLSHYFDFRGLIERGLALEAPEEMYKYEND